MCVERSLTKFYNLVEALESLPSIGKKSAMRLAFYMVRESPMDALRIAHAIEDALSSTRLCQKCLGLSEDELCHICSDDLRDKGVLCLVQGARDISLIEESGEYEGMYMVFDQLSESNLAHLKDLIGEYGTKELIFAFTPSLQNEALLLYIEDQLQHFDLKFTKIAQGVPTGVRLENVDSLSLAKAIADRVEV